MNCLEILFTRSSSPEDEYEEPVVIYYDTLHVIKTSVVMLSGHFCPWCPMSFRLGYRRVDIMQSEPIRGNKRFRF